MKSCRPFFPRSQSCIIQKPQLLGVIWCKVMSPSPTLSSYAWKEMKKLEIFQKWVVWSRNWNRRIYFILVMAGGWHLLLYRSVYIKAGASYSFHQREVILRVITAGFSMREPQYRSSQKAFLFNRTGFSLEFTALSTCKFYSIIPLITKKACEHTVYICGNLFICSAESHLTACKVCGL